MKGKAENKGFKISGKGKIALYAVLAVLVALAIVFTAAQKLGNVTVNTMTDSVKTYFKSMGAGDGYPYELSADSVKDINIYDSNLLVLFNNKTTLLNSTAKEIMPVEHKFSNPVMKTRDSKAIVYDLDSGKYRIQNSAEVIREGEAKTRIMSAAIGRRGNYAIGTYGTDVQSVLTVYSSAGKEIFIWNFKSERISDISLADNGKYAAVSTVYSKEGKISSKLYVFNFSSDKPVSTFDYDSTVLVKVDFINGSNLVAVGDNIRSYIKDGKNRKEDIQFNSDVLHNYCVANCGVSALVRSKFGSESLSSLTVYNKRSKAMYTVDFDKEAKWVDCGEKYTAVLFENEVKTYNKKGKNVGSIKFTGEPLRVAVDENKVYVLTSVSLQCYDVKGN